MSRPQIPDQNYLDTINKMLEEGASIDAIKAATLQKAVGGRYARCVKMLAVYRQEHTEQADAAAAAAMPGWFREMKENAARDIGNALDGLWFVINKEINEAADNAARAFQLKREEIERGQDDQIATIDRLENRVDELEETLEDREGKLANAKLEYRKQFKKFTDTEAGLKERLAVGNERAVGLEKQLSDLQGRYDRLQAQVIQLAGSDSRGN